MNDLNFRSGDCCNAISLKKEVKGIEMDMGGAFRMTEEEIWERKKLLALQAFYWRVRELIGELEERLKEID